MELLVMQPDLDARWQLYRVLSEPVRLRLLALAAEEELSVGELSELLEEPQPNVSRHAAPLRQVGLLADRRQGTRTLVRLSDGAADDAVVADALRAGRRMCEKDGSLSRVVSVVRARDLRTREFFARPPRPSEELHRPPELAAYLAALGLLLERRELAVDAGTGSGVLLDVLAPVFQRVIALDRSEAQLERARQRVTGRGYDNVELVCSEIDDDTARGAVGEGADVVFAARMLHHAPLPRRTLEALSALARPGGRVVIVDYCRHDDEALREGQADVWMGFEPSELEAQARAAGLAVLHVAALPAAYTTGAPDGHVGWQVLVGRRADGVTVTARTGDKAKNGKQSKETRRS
jgi:DNA-binding transcriptional ArsR family regulator/protein-L-isoaspartate O-methyltransferase